MNKKFVARISVHTSSGSWQSAMIPSNLNGEVNKNQLHNFGLRIDETRRKWIYELEGKGETKDCLKMNDMVNNLLSFLEDKLQSKKEGILLVHIFNDLTLAHIMSLMKACGQVQRFKNIVAGFGNLEEV